LDLRYKFKLVPLDDWPKRHTEVSTAKQTYQIIENKVKSSGLENEPAKLLKTSENVKNV
jgi:hypothetical protein